MTRERKLTLLGHITLRGDSCFLCRWIGMDLAAHGKLTSWSPADGPFDPAKNFDVGAKLVHLAIERFDTKYVDSEQKVRILSVD